MALTPGTRLGPHEVLATLGAGGMGEVHRARDHDLKHEVALKVLPSSVAGDAERLARFRREAELLAALDRDGSNVGAHCCRTQTLHAADHRRRRGWSVALEQDQ